MHGCFVVVVDQQWAMFIALCFLFFHGEDSIGYFICGILSEKEILISCCMCFIFKFMSQLFDSICFVFSWLKEAALSSSFLLRGFVREKCFCFCIWFGSLEMDLKSPLLPNEGPKSNRKRNSVASIKRDFFSKLPQKVRSGLDPETPFQIDLSKITGLIEGILYLPCNWVSSPRYRLFLF